jgi:ferredoxin
MNSQLYLKDVATLGYDPEKCTGCGLCVLVCPHRVFQIRDRKAYITDRDRCIECGACVINCREEALWVNRGVGCATAVLNSMINKKEPACGCDAGCKC